MAAKSIFAGPNDFKALLDVTKLLDTSKTRKATLQGPDGVPMILPEPLYKLLRLAARELMEGKGVRILPESAELSTQEAADYLNISRPSLIKLLERGAIQFHMAGTHRRVYLRHVEAYKAARDASAQAALRKLVDEAQDLGIYDE